MPALKPYLCKHCGETSPQQFFTTNNMKSCCKRCHTLHVHQKKRLIKLRAIEYLGGKCNKCEYVGSPAVFDFHHRNPSEKEFGWGDNRTTWDKLKPELDKCMLLCSNCHRELHDKEWYDSLPDYHPEKVRRAG